LKAESPLADCSVPFLIARDGDIENLLDLSDTGVISYCYLIMFRFLIKEIKSLPVPIKWSVLALMVVGSAACVQRFSAVGDAPEPVDLPDAETNSNPIGITVLVPVFLFLP